MNSRLESHLMLKWLHAGNSKITSTPSRSPRAFFFATLIPEVFSRISGRFPLALLMVELNRSYYAIDASILIVKGYSDRTRSLIVELRSKSTKGAECI
jgi:hypothetical protein